MIYLTSDLHLPRRIQRISEENFPEQKAMTKSDYLLVCGDFSAYWDGRPAEAELRSELVARNFTTLFIDGNHENFDLISAYPVMDWKNGKVHRMDDGILHLMRGQVFNIDGVTIFTMGGGYSGKTYKRVEHQNWWKEEIPSREEFAEALENLEKAHWKVDYVLTHTAPMRVIEQLKFENEENLLGIFLDYLDHRLFYKHWYFGHFHQDLPINARQTLIYDDIIRIL